MDSPHQIQGGCLCGRVSIVANPGARSFDACHCGMCRKWGGGPALTVEGGSQSKLTGEEHISIYESSEWAERGFCRHCGTHLFYRLKGTNFVNFFAGLFKEAEKFSFHVQIYIDSKPDSYDFANRTEMMTEAEVIAKFQGAPPS